MQTILFNLFCITYNFSIDMTTDHHKPYNNYKNYENEPHSLHLQVSNLYFLKKTWLD